jgi:DNA modification methylase
MTVRLIRGDALAVLARLPDGSVDAVVTDPPYGQSNEAYDGPIAFGADLWRECYRVAAPNAALISFAGGPTYHRIATAIEAGGWKVRQMWGWVYRDGMITSAWPKEGFDRLAPAMDPIVYATKGKVLLRLEREGAAWDRFTGRTQWQQRAHISLRANGFPAVKGAGHYPRAIVSDSIDGFQYFVLSRTQGGFAAENDGHPNQKPLGLMRWLVSKLPPGGTVLDPFVGSGSTGVAAVQLGFNFIGIEQSAEYLAIARRRIRAAEKERQTA